jgi:hypothetical protein
VDGSHPFKILYLSLDLVNCCAEAIAEAMETDPETLKDESRTAKCFLSSDLELLKYAGVPDIVCCTLAQLITNIH